MMQQTKEKILQLKREKDVCILAHSYQAQEILEVADITGDSFALSKAAMEVPQENLLVCGVHFMAETAKILSPQKKVYLAHKGAGCPMAEEFTPEEILAYRKAEPDRAVVAYVNTTAALKAVSDVCVTSSSAVEIVKKLDAQKILFIPDCNLGSFVQQQVPDKDIQLLDGGCPVHRSVEAWEVEQARKEHPGAELLVHPECIKEVTAQADYAGSTAGIMKYARENSGKEYIIGTEMSIADHLQYQCPDKRFYPLSKKLICPDMKLTTLNDVLLSLEGLEAGEAFEIVMEEKLMDAARVSIQRMIELGE